MFALDVRAVFSPFQSFWSVLRGSLIGRIFIQVCVYSLVSNRRGGWNSRGGQKKSQKLIAGGVGIIGGLEKISEINSRGGWNKFHFLNFRFCNGSFNNNITQ